MFHLSRLVLVCTVAAVSVTASAQPRPGEQDRLIDEILSANESLRYEGLRIVTFRFSRDGKEKSRVITERVVRDGAKSRTEYAGDDEMAGQIAVDDGVNRYQYLPKDNVINRMPSIQSQSGGRLELLMRLKRREFDVRVTEGGMVADLPTILVELVGKDGPMHRMWVEKKGKAILKRAVGGPDPGRGMSYEFQTFKYLRRVDANEFQINKPGAKEVGPEDRLTASAQKIGVEPYVLKRAGDFRLFDAKSFEADGKAVLRSTYGNGRNIITLVQVRGELDRKRLEDKPHQRISVFAWKNDSYSFALIGDLPPEELRRLSGLLSR